MLIINHNKKEKNTYKTTSMVVKIKWFENIHLNIVVYRNHFTLKHMILMLHLGL